MKSLARHPSAATIVADLLDSIKVHYAEQAKACELAARLLRDEHTGGTAKYIDQGSSPLSRRVYLDHARRGSFPTKRVGKRVLVERDTFERWLSAESTKPRRVPAPPASGTRSLDADVLEELGARPAVAR